jgi:Common central domain of tyrosinase
VVDVPYYQGITDQSAPDATAQAIWATCQHSGDTQALNFFGWHRMYLYYFERVLRWAAADDTLRALLGLYRSSPSDSPGGISE